MRIVRKADGWHVPSQTGPGRTYVVNPSVESPHCTCEDFSLRQLPCKHVLAVRLVVQREDGDEAAVPAPDPEAVPQLARPSYEQDWRSYNRAQLGEKRRFQALLADLCRCVPEPVRAKTGRKPVPLADRLFAVVFKVYVGMSSRRFNTDLRDAHEAGHLSRTLHPNKVNAFMENADLADVLRQLVIDSSKPLAAVEQHFAADSTGFSGSRFARWFDKKYGHVRESREWIKVQVMVGTRTNVVTAVEVCEQDGADSPYLPGLVETTAANFDIKEVSADKGYSSVDGHEAVARVGGTPFIAFKSVATGWSGGLFGKMFHYFQYRREEFLRHYHRRSNVESTFSAVKRKFGDSLRSKSKPAMVNEVLCKLLCFNLVTLIHEQEELGIAPEFFNEPPEEEPAILPFRMVSR